MMAGNGKTILRLVEQETIELCFRAQHALGQFSRLQIGFRVASVAGAAFDRSGEGKFDLRHIRRWLPQK